MSHDRISHPDYPKTHICGQSARESMSEAAQALQEIALRRGWGTHWIWSCYVWTNAFLLWMEEILHQLIGGLYWFIPLFIGFQPSKVVQDFFHPPYVSLTSVSVRSDGFWCWSPWDAPKWLSSIQFQAAREAADLIRGANPDGAPCLNVGGSLMLGQEMLGRGFSMSFPWLPSGYD